MAGQNYNMEMPKDLAARAGAYLKLKQYNMALADLKKAASINHYYLWNIGNYYEVIENKDSAISCYIELYVKDTVVYKYCKDRVSELKNPKTKLFKELVYRDRERLVILMQGVK
jgi:tetratricopeptide (TPR) repeat protein